MGHTVPRAPEDRLWAGCCAKQLWGRLQVTGQGAQPNCQAMGPKKGLEWEKLDAGPHNLP